MGISNPAPPVSDGFIMLPGVDAVPFRVIKTVLVSGMIRYTLLVRDGTEVRVVLETDLPPVS